ncbi:ABC transporter ATP-binding protein [Novosphingobium sp.]|uniref:ABC transporter ATP-binding protein n=1 Tax=Novosphingobium sp. TaxID=1874826 RepID=UPI003D133A1B
MASVQLRNLSKAFGDVAIIRDVTLAIAHGEFVALVGPSGSGKSTLLRMIAGLETISSGTIEIGDRVVNDVPPKHRDIAMVFQSYALYPHMTVRENLGFALKLRGWKKAEIHQRVSEAAASLNLGALLDRYPRQLSGGQRQRVATGRAIVRDPAVFLFDEPLSNLDAALRVQVRAELRQLHRRLGVTTVYVTHDQVEAMTMADTIVVLRDGSIEQVGAPLDLYDRPANTFVATFIGSPAMNLITGSWRDHALVLDDGSVLPVDPALVPEPGARLTVGVRPDHIDVVTDGEDGICARVLALEPTGAETVIMAELAGAAITIVTRVRLALGPGDPIRLRPVPGRQLYFDATGQRITA